MRGAASPGSLVRTRVVLLAERLRLCLTVRGLRKPRRLTHLSWDASCSNKPNQRLRHRGLSGGKGP